VLVKADARTTLTVGDMPPWGWGVRWAPFFVARASRYIASAAPRPVSLLELVLNDTLLKGRGKWTTSEALAIVSLALGPLWPPWREIDPQKDLFLLAGSLAYAIDDMRRRVVGFQDPWLHQPVKKREFDLSLHSFRRDRSIVFEVKSDGAYYVMDRWNNGRKHLSTCLERAGIKHVIDNVGPLRSDMKLLTVGPYSYTIQSEKPTALEATSSKWSSFTIGPLDPSEATEVTGHGSEAGKLTVAATVSFTAKSPFAVHLLAKQKAEGVKQALLRATAKVSLTNSQKRHARRRAARARKALDTSLRMSDEDVLALRQAMTTSESAIVCDNGHEEEVCSAWYDTVDSLTSKAAKRRAVVMASNSPEFDRDTKKRRAIDLALTVDAGVTVADARLLRPHARHMLAIIDGAIVQRSVDNVFIAAKKFRPQSKIK
jgi:hypothetical protein